MFALLLFSSSSSFYGTPIIVEIYVLRDRMLLNIALNYVWIYIDIEIKVVNFHHIYKRRICLSLKFKNLSSFTVLVRAVTPIKPHKNFFIWS